MDLKPPKPTKAMMVQFLKTMSVGYLLSFIVEFINMGIGQGEWVGMVLTVLIFYGLFIAVGFALSQWILKNPIAHFLVFGFIGLMAEWFIFGMAPWAGGLPCVMMLIQVGMFSHWASVTFAPRLLLEKDPRYRGLKLRYIISYAIGMGLVFILGLATPAKARWTIMILGNVVVYSFLLVWYVNYIILFYKAKKEEKTKKEPTSF